MWECDVIEIYLKTISVLFNNTTIEKSVVEQKDNTAFTSKISSS